MPPRIAIAFETATTGAAPQASRPRSAVSTATAATLPADILCCFGCASDSRPSRAAQGVAGSKVTLPPEDAQQTCAPTQLFYEASRERQRAPPGQTHWPSDPRAKS